MTEPQPPRDLRLPRPHLDPTRHVLIYPKFERRPDGTELMRPIPLDEAAAEWRAAAEAGAVPPPPTRGPARDVVVTSRTRCTVYAAMLDELSLRLKPGLAVGPIESDGSLSRLAKELADELNRDSWG